MNKDLQFISRIFLYCCMVGLTIYMIVIIAINDEYDLSEQKYRFMILYSSLVLINVLVVVGFDTILYNVDMNGLSVDRARQYDTVNLRLKLQIIFLGIVSFITFLIITAYSLDNLPHRSLSYTFHITVVICLTLFILQHRFIRSIAHIIGIICNTVDSVFYELMIPYYNFDSIIYQRETRLQSNANGETRLQSNANGVIVVNQTLSSEDSQSNESDTDECKICFAPNTIIVRLNCKHLLCIDCAKSWLSQKKSCPFCRTTNLSVEQSNQSDTVTSTI